MLSEGNMYINITICCYELISKTKSALQHKIHAFIYMNARSLYSRNKVLQNVNCCVMNQKIHYVLGLAFFALTFTFPSVQQLVYRYCGHWDIAASRHVRFWCFRYSFWRMLWNYNIVVCNVAHVCRLGRPAFKM